MKYMEVKNIMQDSIIDTDDNRDAIILGLAKSGMAYNDIGLKVGLSKSRVSQICLENGFIKRPFETNIGSWRQSW